MRQYCITIMQKKQQLCQCLKCLKHLNIMERFLYYLDTSEAGYRQARSISWILERPRSFAPHGQGS